MAKFLNAGLIINHPCANSKVRHINKLQQHGQPAYAHQFFIREMVDNCSEKSDLAFLVSFLLQVWLPIQNTQYMR